jgi:hypothetical protein
VGRPRQLTVRASVEPQAVLFGMPVAGWAHTEAVAARSDAERVLIYGLGLSGAASLPSCASRPPPPPDKLLATPPPTSPAWMRSLPRPRRYPVVPAGQGPDPVLPGPRLAATASEVPPGCVIDGEAVIWTGGPAGLLRAAAAPRRRPKIPLPELVSRTPANYDAFDVFAVAGHDARALPLHRRRALLDELAHECGGPLVRGAVIGPITQPREVVAGLVLGGELWIVGHFTPLKAAAARELARWLEPPRRVHPWPRLFITACSPNDGPW